jgi:hypothetical protein
MSSRYFFKFFIYFCAIFINILVIVFNLIL